MNKPLREPRDDASALVSLTKRQIAWLHSTLTIARRAADEQVIDINHMPTPFVQGIIDQLAVALRGLAEQ